MGNFVWCLCKLWNFNVFKEIMIKCWFVVILIVFFYLISLFVLLYCRKLIGVRIVDKKWVISEVWLIV